MELFSYGECRLLLGHRRSPTATTTSAGLAYAARGASCGNLTYGWVEAGGGTAADNLRAAVRNNAKSPSPVFDTLIPMQEGVGYAWAVQVPNGSYVVRIIASDPAFAASDPDTYKIAAEGTTVIDGVPTEGLPWVVGVAAVTVADGKLRLSSAPATAASNLLTAI